TSPHGVAPTAETVASSGLWIAAAHTAEPGLPDTGLGMQPDADDAETLAIVVELAFVAELAPPLPSSNDVPSKPSSRVQAAEEMIGAIPNAIADALSPSRMARASVSPRVREGRSRSCR